MAKMETAEFQCFSYVQPMKDWLEEAIRHGRTDQAKLARDLTAVLGRSIDRAAMNKMVKGTRQIKADELVAISKITNYPLPPSVSAPSEPEGTFTPPPQLFSDGPSLPVYSGAEGGEGHMIVDTHPVDWLPRPQMLHNVRDAYAILITGESMVPAFEPGDHALVHPRLPPMRGTDVILYEINGDGDAKASIKRLVSWTDAEWTLQQWNPAKTFKLKRAEWPKCHRVVGKFSRR